MIKTIPNDVQLAEVIAIDEYKADTDEGKYQLIISNVEQASFNSEDIEV